MSLMDDFELGKLKNGWYWVLTPDSVKPFPAFCFRGEFDGHDGALNDCVSEVIAPCDYELTEKVKALENEVAKGDRIIGKLLNEGNAAIEKNKQFSGLLKECAEYIEGDIEFRENEDAMYCRDILTRIDTALGENERPDND